MVEVIKRSVVNRSPALPADLVIYHSPTGKTLHIAGTILGALALGFFGLFAMFPIGSAGIDRIVLLLYPIIAGGIIGLLSPRLWAVSVLVAWGGLILVNITSLGGTAGVLVAIVRMAVYITLALIAGYLGQMARKAIDNKQEMTIR